jgi:hypothetical protein
VTVLTDDERPFVIYGETERKSRKATSSEKTEKGGNGGKDKLT